jgi:hypothetical protein
MSGRSVIYFLRTVLILAVFLKLLELICVCGTDKLPIHIEDLSLRVHQKLTIIALNLNSSHDHVVLHVDAHLLCLSVSIGCALWLSAVWLC